jgi:hypothetical protein
MAHVAVLKSASWGQSRLSVLFGFRTRYGKGIIGILMRRVTPVRLVIGGLPARVFIAADRA